LLCKFTQEQGRGFASAVCSLLQICAVVQLFIVAECISVIRQYAFTITTSLHRFSTRCATAEMVIKLNFLSVIHWMIWTSCSAFY